MLMKKMVTEEGQNYYVFYENSFDDKELLVYTEAQYQQVKDQYAQADEEGNQGADGSAEPLGKEED